MSIFLLISIGSVSAGDAAMDADAQLANDGPDVALNDAAQIDTKVVSQDVKINEGETANIPVTVQDNESQSLKITTKDLNVTEKNKTIKFDYNNSMITIKDKLSAGNHNLIISYLGNANYASSSVKVTLSIVGDTILSTPDSVNVNSTKKAVIPINLTDSVDVYPIDKNNLTLVLSYKDGNDTVNKTISEFELNGAIKFNYDTKITSSTLTINYANGNKTLTKEVALKYLINAKIIPINLEAEYVSGNFTFKLEDIDDSTNILANKKLSYLIPSGTINTGGSITTDANGIATLDNSNLRIYKFENGTLSSEGPIPVGKQPFTIKGDDSSISAPTIEDDFTIIKANINIVINPYKEPYKSGKQVVINVTNAKSGAPMKGIILHLYMANTTAKDYYLQTGSNGICEINVSGLVSGVYPLTISNNDTKNINYKEVNGTITITGKPVKLTTKMTNPYYYNTGILGTVTVTDRATGEPVPNAILLVYTDASSQGYLYQANDKGVVTIDYAILPVGSHKVTITSADSRYSSPELTKTVNVKKASGKFTAPALTTYYKSGDNFVIKLTNTKTQQAIYGANVDIKVYVSGGYYQYSAQTGMEGTVQLSLESLTPGTYKVVISPKDSKNYTASKVTSKIVIKKTPAKLIPTKVTAKQGESKYFKVTVKNTKLNKVISGVKVKIKVYTGKTAKTYTATTNSKGIAQINVKSMSVGTHKVVVTSGDKYCTASAVTSSITIKKA